MGAPLELSFIGWLTYLLVCNGLPNGHSIGKRAVGCSVIQAVTEKPCTYWRSVGKDPSLLILGVIDAAFIIGEQRRRLGDFIANTKVVKLKN